MMFDYSENLISIEIGSSSVKVLASEPADKNEVINFICAFEVPYSSGSLDIVTRGDVTNSQVVSDALEKALMSIEDFGCDVSAARYYFVISGRSTTSKTKINHLNFDKQTKVSQEHLDEIGAYFDSDQAPVDSEVIYNKPHNWQIKERDQRTILGQVCSQFTQENFIVSCQIELIRNISSIIYDLTGREPVYHTFSPIATATAVMNERAMRKGSLVIDLGDELTSFALFHNGHCCYAMSLEVGVKHIINDLHIGLNMGLDADSAIDFELARAVLLKHGTAVLPPISKEAVVSIGDHQLSERVIHQIINLRLTEIIERVRYELEQYKVINKVGNCVFLTGGGARIKKIKDLVKDTFKNTPVDLGTLQTDYHRVHLDEPLDSLTYSAVAGLAIMAIRGGDASETSVLEYLKHIMSKVIFKFKKIFNTER